VFNEHRGGYTAPSSGFPRIGGRSGRIANRADHGSATSLFCIRYRPPWDGAVRCGSSHPLPEELVVVVPPADVKMLFAHRQWRAGLLLADAVATGAVISRDLRVLELGAGTGLPSLCAVLAGARAVVVTDYDSPELIARLRTNVYANVPEPLAAERGRVRVAGHTWGRADAEDLLPWDGGKEACFDAVLCADVLWERFAHRDLLKTLARVLARDGAVHLVSGLHTGRGVLGSFFRLADAAGFEVWGIGVDREVYEWRHARDAADFQESGVDRRAVRAALSGERRLFDSERLDEPIGERNQWITRATLRWKKGVKTAQ
jgi:nicotinamide N-methyltransferase